MKKSDEKFIKNWKASRRLGRVNYGFIHGSVFAILVMTMVKIITFLTGENDSFFSSSMIFEYGLGILCGIVFFSSFMWWLNERIYQTRVPQ